MGFRVDRPTATLRDEACATCRWLFATRLISARHPGPDHFFALDAIHPELAGDGIERALGLARSSTVEIMAHPDRDATNAVLHSASWATALAGLRLGTYADLSRL